MKVHKFSYDDPKPEIYSSFSGGLAFDYPEELIDALDRFQGDKLEFVLKNLESEAEKVLRAEGYDPALSELPWYDGYEMGVQLAGAKQVLLSAHAIRDLVDRNESALVALEMMLIITAAIKAEVSVCLFEGLAKIKGQSKKKPPRRSLFVIKAINRELDNKKSLTAGNLWRRFEKYTSLSPLEIDGAEIYMDGVMLCEECDDKVKSISKSTFEGYVKKIKRERK